MEQPGSPVAPRRVQSFSADDTIREFEGACPLGGFSN